MLMVRYYYHSAPCGARVSACAGVIRRVMCDARGGETTLELSHPNRQEVGLGVRRIN